MKKSVKKKKLIDEGWLCTDTYDICIAGDPDFNGCMKANQCGLVHIETPIECVGVVDLTELPDEVIFWKGRLVCVESITDEEVGIVAHKTYFLPISYNLEKKELRIVNDKSAHLRIR